MTLGHLGSFLAFKDFFIFRLFITWILTFWDFLLDMNMTRFIRF